MTTCRNKESIDIVLIETLWNVKEINGFVIMALVGVLIETLWNVKKDRMKFYLYSDLGFNRNIVECKE